MYKGVFITLMTPDAQCGAAGFAAIIKLHFCRQFSVQSSQIMKEKLEAQGSKDAAVRYPCR